MCPRNFLGGFNEMEKENKLFSKYWTPQQFIRKPVIDSKGNDCGKIQTLCIDPQTFTISGIMVKKRLSKEYFISRTYFEPITDSSLTLNSIPIKPNDKVVDVDRKNMGKVISINLNSETNKIESIKIKSGFKSKIIPADKIVGVGEKITIKT